LAETVK
jgi:hypothetical protein